MMRYAVPNCDRAFEIPDEWLAEAAVIGYLPTAGAYLSDREATCIPLCEIDPPLREPGFEKDGCGFDRARMVRILKGFVAGVSLPPVSLRKRPETPNASSPYRFQMHDGYHRFYASIAAGFDLIPGISDQDPPV